MTYQDVNMDPVRLKSLNCYLIPARGRLCAKKYRYHYQEAYALWKKTMGDALRYESQIAEPELSSDEFFRQCEIISIFSGEMVVGIFILDWVDLSFESTLEHSYFSYLPVGIVEKLKSKGLTQIMTASNLCVHPDWRRSKVGSGISQICYGLAAKRLMMSKASCMLTFTRNNRGVHHLVYEIGGQALMQDFMAHGIPSDIITVHRDGVKPCSNPIIQESINRLNDEAIDAHINADAMVNRYFELEEVVF